MRRYLWKEERLLWEIDEFLRSRRQPVQTQGLFTASVNESQIEPVYASRQECEALVQATLAAQDYLFVDGQATLVIQECRKPVRTILRNLQETSDGDRKRRVPCADEAPHVIEAKGVRREHPQ